MDLKVAGVNKKILVVEDNGSDIKLIRDLLHPFGYKIEMAFDGEGALDMLKTSRPDLIILDIGLPGMDGFLTCKKIKENPEWRSIKVAALTGLVKEQEREEMWKYGFDEIIFKDIDINGLVRSINRILIND